MTLLLGPLAAYPALAPVPVPVSPPLGGGGVGAAAWRSYGREQRRKLKKREKELIERLGDLVVEVEERIEVTSDQFDELHRAKMLADIAMYKAVSYTELLSQIARIKEVLDEIDDEESILLMQA